MIRNQTGMEMAIQIFIVLFVLLAVSMLVLQLVSQQFGTQTRQIEEQNKKEALKQLKASNKIACESLCTDGSLQAQYQYCAKAFDFSMGAVVSQFNDKDFGAEGICEDRVYCSQLAPCKVGSTELTAKNCKQILCQTMKQTFCADPTACTPGEQTLISNKLIEFIKPGSCYANATAAEQSTHWFGLSYDTIGTKNGTIDAGEGCTFP